METLYIIIALLTGILVFTKKARQIFRELLIEEE